MSTYEEDLAAVSSEIDSYEESKIFVIGMPYIHYLQQAQLLCSRILKYEDKFSKNKVSLELVDKLKKMIGACRELLSETSITVFSTSESQKAWDSKKEEADFLLYDIKEAGVYACRDHEELLKLVYSIYNEGASNTDMIQDLNDYAVFGRKHRELFDAINYDFSNFERSAQLSREMNELLALATLDKTNSPERIRRNKAFCLAKQTIDELIAKSRYVFRDDKKKASEFIIKPPRRKPSKITEEPEQKPELTP